MDWGLTKDSKNNMNETKSKYLSKGFWGGVVALASALNLFWQLKTGQTLIGDEELNTLVSNMASVAGAVLAIYGRMVANKQIK